MCDRSISRRRLVLLKVSRCSLERPLRLRSSDSSECRASKEPESTPEIRLEASERRRRFGIEAKVSRVT